MFDGVWYAFLGVCYPIRRLDFVEWAFDWEHGSCPTISGVVSQSSSQDLSRAVNSCCSTDMFNPFHSRSRTAIAINMTPMIDVTFLLIIFFLVSSHLSKQETQVKLDLPATFHAVSADLLAAENSLTLNVFEDGGLRLGSNPVDLQQLEKILVAKNALVDGRLQVRIRCSQNAAFGTVNPILAVLVTAQVTDVVFAVYEDMEGGSK